MKRIALPLLAVLMLLVVACGGAAIPEASSDGAVSGTTDGTTAGTTAGGSGGSADILAVTPDLRNRPRTGIFVKKQGGGTGFIEVTNNSGLDAAVYLLDAENALAQAGYVRAEELIRLSGFREGEYTLYVIAGNGWDMGLMNFTQEPTYYRYPETLAVEGGSATTPPKVEVSIEADTAASGEALTFEDFPALR